MGNKIQKEFKHQNKIIEAYPILNPKIDVSKLWMKK
jgi:hypothetical protein